MTEQKIILKEYVNFEENNYWECRSCRHRSNGRLNRIIAHLTRTPRMGIRICQKISPEQTEKLKSELGLGPMYPSPVSLGLKRPRTPEPSSFRAIRDSDMGITSPLMWLQEGVGDQGIPSLNIRGFGVTPWKQPRLDASLSGLPPEAYKAVADAALHDMKRMDPSKSAFQSVLQLQQSQNASAGNRSFHRQILPESESQNTFIQGFQEIHPACHAQPLQQELQRQATYYEKQLQLQATYYEQQLQRQATYYEQQLQQQVNQIAVQQQIPSIVSTLYSASQSSPASVQKLFILEKLSMKIQSIKSTRYSANQSSLSSLHVVLGKLSMVRMGTHSKMLRGILQFVHWNVIFIRKSLNLVLEIKIATRSKYQPMGREETSVTISVSEENKWSLKNLKKSVKAITSQLDDSEQTSPFYISDLISTALETCVTISVSEENIRSLQNLNKSVEAITSRLDDSEQTSPFSISDLISSPPETWDVIMTVPPEKCTLLRHDQGGAYVPNTKNDGFQETNAVGLDPINTIHQGQSSSLDSPHVSFLQGSMDLDMGDPMLSPQFSFNYMNDQQMHTLQDGAGFCTSSLEDAFGVEMAMRPGLVDPFPSPPGFDVDLWEF